MASSGPSQGQLTSAQLRALLDVLTHYETYDEVSGFKRPETMEKYGYPFGGKHIPSSSPLMQLLMVKLALPFADLLQLPLDFWNSKCRELLINFAAAELSESYDKGALGTRKRLATITSAILESVIRGILGGVSPEELAQDKVVYGPKTAEGLEAASTAAVREAIYGDLVDRLFDYATTSSEFQSFSPTMHGFIECTYIHIATFLHQIMVVSPEGPYLLKLMADTNRLVPYTMVMQTLRVGNAATMINGMVRLFLTKLGISGLTNWLGITSDAPNTTMNLLQKIISVVLDWDASDFRKTSEKLKKAKHHVSQEHFSTIDQYISKATRAEHEAVRAASVENSEAIIKSIFKSSPNPKLAVTLTETQYAQCLAYYSARLAVRDREEIVNVLCRQTPDSLTELVRQAVNGSTPIIKVLHDNVQLHKYVGDVQEIIDDFLKTSQPKKGSKKGESIQPAVDDYVGMVQRAAPTSFKFLHETAKGCPEIRDQVKDAVKEMFFAFRGAGTGASSLGGAGVLSPELQSIFSSLSPDTQKPVLAALDAHAGYLRNLEAESNARMQRILDRLRAGGGKAPPDSSGPGMYLASWNNLLDETLITPKTSHGRARTGLDVKGLSGLGKTDLNESEELQKSQSSSDLPGTNRDAIEPNGGDSLPTVPLSWEIRKDGKVTAGCDVTGNGKVDLDAPDVGIVVQMLGRPFKELATKISSQAVSQV